MQTSVDRTSALPLYAQLKEILLRKIQANEWQAGQLIPSEHELEDHYNVSRTTIRQTLNDLVLQGYLVRQRGRGTFIAHPKVAYDPAKRLETNEYYSAQGVSFGWKLLGSEWIPSSAAVAALLGVDTGAQVLRLRRLRTTSDEIIGLHIAYVPMSSALYVNESHFCEGESLNYLSSHPKMTDAHVERTLEAVLADKHDAELLKVQRNSPILAMERVLRAKDGAVLEVLDGRFVGDRFKYRFTT